MSKPRSVWLLSFCIMVVLCKRVFGRIRSVLFWGSFRAQLRLYLAHDKVNLCKNTSIPITPSQVKNELVFVCHLLFTHCIKCTISQSVCINQQCARHRNLNSTTITTLYFSQHHTTTHSNSTSLAHPLQTQDPFICSRPGCWMEVTYVPSSKLSSVEYGVTKELLQVIEDICSHPETFTEFPIGMC